MSSGTVNVHYSMISRASAQLVPQRCSYMDRGGSNVNVIPSASHISAASIVPHVELGAPLSNK